MAQVTELAGHVLGGKYRLVRAVSDGPRAVYEARHERLAGRFAVKRWPATTPWDVFRQGAELAVTLRHPGVMQVLDFNCEPGAPPFLVLEWVDGARLSDVIAECGILPIERVAPLIESAAWALASAHQQGIVHQELRPDEVFVVHAPGTMREWVKIAGFGVSAALARAGTAAPSRYRAPEQRDGAGDEGEENDDGADPQSDQYALAAIAYEMLAGVPPFDKERSRAEPLPISDLAPGVSPAVDAAIRQALANEPEQRFAGVLEFARALRDAVEGASPEALRRRSAATVSGERRARPPETVSPFFNPLQGRASEVFRRVASSTARLRSLASGSGSGPRGTPTTRVALAGAALILVVTATGLVLRRHAPTPALAPTPTPPALAPAPVALAPPVPAAAPAPAVPASAPAPAVPAAAPAPAIPAPSAAVAPASPGDSSDDAARENLATGKQLRVAAWSRLGGPAKPRPKPKAATAAPAKTATLAKADASAKASTTASTKASTKTSAKKTSPKASAKMSAPAPKPAATVALTKASAASSTASCTMTVGSKPWADVWLDDHSLGHRTPLVGYKTACGDHKLALKRTDLDLYQMEIVTLRAGAPFKKSYPLR